jgi:hypothetical protein
LSNPSTKGILSSTAQRPANPIIRYVDKCGDEYKKPELIIMCSLGLTQLGDGWNSVLVLVLHAQQGKAVSLGKVVLVDLEDDGDGREVHNEVTEQIVQEGISGLWYHYDMWF